jgi:hypothetical protein
MAIAIKDGSGSSVNLAGFVDSAGSQIPTHSNDSTVAHYRAAKSALTPVATPTTVGLIQGSASKTIRIKRVAVGGAATAYGSMVCYIERWSTAGTPGSAVLTGLTAAKHDSGNGAATAVVSTVGTANYTTRGTTAGVVGAGRVNMTAIGSAATSSAQTWTEWDFTTRSDQALVLRGTAEYLAIDLGGAAVPSGGVIDFEVEWSEDAS